MPPAVTRELSVTYGATTVGGTSAVYLLHGPVRIDKSYDRVTVSFQVACTDISSEANFAATAQALEAAFRKPWQALTITLGSTTVASYSHTSNTGYNAQPSIQETGDERYETGRSRLYAISVTCEVPADLSGQSGRRYSSVALEKSPAGQNTVTISGRYTALSGNSARAQYEASIEAYVSAVLTAIGGTYEKVAETASADDQNKNLDFARTYLELLYNQSQGTLDNTTIFRHSVLYTRQAVGPGDAPRGNARRLERVSAVYEAWVEKATTDLESVYQNTIRPFLLAQVQEIWTPSLLALIEEGTPMMDRTAQRIQGTLTFAMVTTGSGVLEYAERSRIENEPGVVFTPVANGNALAKHVDDGPARRLRTMSRRSRIVGERSPSDGAFRLGDGFKWHLTRSSVEIAPVKLGLDDTAFNVYDEMLETVEEWAEPPESGGGGTTTPDPSAPPTSGGGGGDQITPLPGPGAGAPSSTGGDSRAIAPGGGSTQPIGPGGGIPPNLGRG
jgi:hypothetical protein